VNRIFAVGGAKAVFRTSDRANGGSSETEMLKVIEGLNEILGAV
jgi:hypothetical protein